MRLLIALQHVGFTCLTFIRLGRQPIWTLGLTLAACIGLSFISQAYAAPCGATVTTTTENSFLPRLITDASAVLSVSRPSPVFIVKDPIKSSGTPATDKLDSGCVAEFATPSQKGGAYMIVGPDHYLWFTENGGTIARMNPNSPYEMTEFGPLAGGGGLQLTIGADGNIWFAEQGSFDCNQDPPSRIGRILAHPPYTITEFPVPGPISPLYGITGGPDGNLWFTRLGNPGGCSPSGQTEIDSISAFAPNRIRRYPLPAFSDVTPSPTKPEKIIAGPDGNLWFNISPYMGLISPTTHKIMLFPIPGATGNFADFNIGPVSDPDSIWFIPVIGSQQFMGRIGTKPPYPISLFPLAIAGSVNSVVAGPDGNIWFTEARTEYAIGQFEVAAPHNVTELDLPDDVYARAATCGPDGNLWFTETQNPLGMQGIPGKVGRVQGFDGFGGKDGLIACELQQIYMSSGGLTGPSLPSGD